MRIEPAGRGRSKSCSIALLVVGAWLSSIALSPAGQDSNHAAPDGPVELVVVGRLDQIEESPHCGFFHFGAVAVYSTLKVVAGRYSKSTVQVVHGCPELSREQYREGAGTLVTFKVGEYHRLWLTRGEEPGMVVVETKGQPSRPRYFCRRVDADNE